MINIVGLLFDIAGAWLLIFGELRGNAAFLTYQGIGDFKSHFDNDVNKLMWWNRWPLKLGRALGSKNPSKMGQESIYDSFPPKAWGILLLTIGFALQAVASFTCQK